MFFDKIGPSATKILVAAALTVGSTVTAAPAMAACQAGQAGCVLPIADVPPAPPVSETPPPPPAEVAGPVAEAAAGGGGISLLLVAAIIGLAAIAAYFLFIEDDEPVTP